MKKAGCRSDAVKDAEWLEINDMLAATNCFLRHSTERDERIVVIDL